MSKKFTPRKYQRKGVNLMIRKYNGRALLADDMGLGKSLQAIMFCERTKGRVIIICPSPLKFNWLNEFRKFTNIEPFICEGQTPMKMGQLRKHRVFICNYEILTHWRNTLLRLKAKTIIADESHYLKNKDAQRTKAALVLSKACKNRLALTGTPIENNPAELFTQLKFVNPSLFPSWLLFVKKYNGAKMGVYGWKLNRATNVKELHKKLLQTCMIRRKKEDVLPELPKKVRQVIPVTITNRVQYDRAEADIIAWLKNNSSLDLEKAKKVEQTLKLDKLKLLSARGKIKTMTQWINNESPKEKLVVFCYHREIVESFSKSLKNCIVIDSSIRGKARQDMVDKFQEDDSVRVLLTTIKIGGTGLTLTASSTTVFIQQDWNASKHDQAEDRVYRIGQEADSVRALYFIAKDTVEEKIIKLIDARRKESMAIIDGKTAKKSQLLEKLLKSMTKGK